MPRLWIWVRARPGISSTHAPGDVIKKILEESPFEGVTLGYSAMNFPFREVGLRAASKKGLGVMIMNPLGGGMIPQNEAVFRFLKVHPEQTILEAALHFLMSHESITSALVGFRNEEDVDSADAAIKQFPMFTY